MKKIVFIFFGFLLLLPNKIDAKQEVVTFSKCVDGDTAKIKKDSKIYTVRFLAIDTPETVKKNADIEPYGKQASNYTCTTLKNAKKIVLEYDPKSSETDKYGRLLAWVYADGKMLQEELLKKGYAEVAYLYGKYLYTDTLKELQAEAKAKKIGMWSLTEEERDGCVIDGKIEKQSSGKCKGTSKVKKKTTKQTTKTKKENIFSLLADFLIDSVLDSLKQFFDNLF